MRREHYPSAGEVDAWCSELVAQAEAAPAQAEILETPTYTFQLGVRHQGALGRYVAFRCGGEDPFYGYWQPVPSGGPAPLLVHLPGYGAEMSAHPELALAGHNVLHVNPLGYATPTGPDESKREPDGYWPVLPETVRSAGERGYRDWLRQAVAAVAWAQGQPSVEASRVGTFGTSQGGGTALLLASLLRERGVKAVAADVPFLTNFPLTRAQPGSATSALTQALERLVEEQPEALPGIWRALGSVDTLSHAHRLTMPVLLTAGTEDAVCSPESIRSLFELLPGTRSYTELAGQAHGYTPSFLALAAAWFGYWV